MSFRLGSIPVHVQGAFFLTMLFLGMNVRDPARMVVWVAVVFVSVLVHELGHALMGRAFGWIPSIELHGMGGTTSYATEGKKLGSGKRIAISLAGPFAGFALGAIVFVLASRLPSSSELAADAVRYALFVNIGWGVFNLLPLLPLDGGNVMHEVANAMTNGRGEKPARIISLVLCVGLLLLAFTQKNWWVGVLAVMFAVTNVRGLKAAGTRRADVALAEAIQQAEAALREQDGARAIALVRPVLSGEATPELRSLGVQVLAYAMLLEGQWTELVPLLEAERALVPEGELQRYARTARELGHEGAADRLDVLARPRAEGGDALAQFKA